MELRIARATDRHVCPQTHPSPHVGGPIEPKIATHLFVEGLPIARLADLVGCAGGGAKDLIVEGAASVLVGGLPCCSETQATLHGGTLVGGASTVFIGGPAFGMPPNFTIVGSTRFANKVIRDLFMLRGTKTGAALLKQLAFLGLPIEIHRIAEANSYCRRVTRPGPSGSRIFYNPGISVWAEGLTHQRLRTAPQVVLAHELVHALNNARGHGYDRPDPRAPELSENEAAAIGAGSHSRDFPTENSLRRDLGGPVRANHHTQAGGDAPTANYRPGGY